MDEIKVIPVNRENRKNEENRVNMTSNPNRQIKGYKTSQKEKQYKLNLERQPSGIKEKIKEIVREHGGKIAIITAALIASGALAIAISSNDTKTPTQDNTNNIVAATETPRYANAKDNDVYEKIAREYNRTYPDSKILANDLGIVKPNETKYYIKDDEGNYKLEYKTLAELNDNEEFYMSNSLETYVVINKETNEVIYAFGKEGYGEDVKMHQLKSAQVNIGGKEYKTPEGKECVDMELACEGVENQMYYDLEKKYEYTMHLQEEKKMAEKENNLHTYDETR